MGDAVEAREAVVGVVERYVKQVEDKRCQEKHWLQKVKRQVNCFLVFILYLFNKRRCIQVT